MKEMEMNYVVTRLYRGRFNISNCKSLIYQQLLMRSNDIIISNYKDMYINIVRLLQITFFL